MRIEPRARWALPDLGEIWRNRELLFFLTWRNIRVRYKQTILGGLWAILQPVLATVVFTIFFGGLANIPSDGVPYYLFSLAAMIPWTYFSTGFEQSATSLVSESNLITKVYFPRVAVPASYVFSGLIDLGVALVVLLGVVLVVVGMPPAAVLLVPVLVLVATFTALGAGMFFAALNVLFRDVKHTLPFIRQLWLFVSPVVYPASLLGEPWRSLYALNPMVGVIEGFRWALLPVDTNPIDLIVISSVSSVVILVCGALFFRRTEVYFADVV